MSADTRFPLADLEAHLGQGSTTTVAQRLGVTTRTV